MKIKYLLLFIISISLLFSGCSLFKKKLLNPIVALDRVPNPPKEKRKKIHESLDLDRLQLEMGVERSAEHLGFYQKKVNPCDYHIPGAEGAACGNKKMTWIHFRILCRASEGTVESVSRFEFQPLDGAEVKYKLGKLFKGKIRTDEEGFGQIRVLTKHSLRNKKLILTANGHILGVVAGSVRKLVVPNSWCANR